MAIKLDKSKLVRNLAKKNVLAPYLDKVFDTWDEPWQFTYEPKQSDDAWHPSGDCLPEASELYAKVKDPEHDVISGSLRKSFMVGHYWHQLIQHIVLEKLEFCEPNAIERSGWRGWGLHTNTYPMSYQAHHWVRGSGDIAPLVTPKWRGIVDIKTISSNQFKQSTLPEWAADKYLCQIQIYMDLFDEEQGLILGVNKDAPHDFKEFTYTRDQDLIDAIYAKWKFVSEALDNDYEPTEKDNEEFALPL